MTTGKRDRRTGGMSLPGVGMVAVLLVALALAWLHALRWAGFPLGGWWVLAMGIGLICCFATPVVAAFVNGRRSAAFLIGLVLTATFLAGPIVGAYLLFSTINGLDGLFAAFDAWGEPDMGLSGRRSIAWFVHGAFAALFFLVQAFAILRACAVWKGR